MLLVMGAPVMSCLWLVMAAFCLMVGGDYETKKWSWARAVPARNKFIIRQNLDEQKRSYCSTGSR
jgi:hypothetical protein